MTLNKINHSCTCGSTKADVLGMIQINDDFVIISKCLKCKKQHTHDKDHSTARKFFKITNKDLSDIIDHGKNNKIV